MADIEVKCVNLHRQGLRKLEECEGLIATA